MCIKIVDNQHHRSIHRHTTSSQRNVIGSCFGCDVVIDVHIAVRRIDRHRSSDVGIGSAAVDRHNEGGICTRQAACHGSSRANSSGNTRRIDPNLTDDITVSFIGAVPDGAASFDGCLGPAAEIGSGRGAIHSRHACAKHTIGGQNLAEVHVAMDGDGVFVGRRACLGNGASHDSIGFTEHQQHGDTQVNADNTAGDHQRQQPDRRLTAFIGRFAIVAIFCARICVKGLVFDVDTVICIIDSPWLIGHAAFTGLHILKLCHRLRARGCFHQNGAARTEGGFLANLRVYIGVENGHGNTDTQSAHTGRHNAGGNIGIEHIAGGNADVSSGSNCAAGIDDGRHRVLVDLAREDSCRAGMCYGILRVVDILVLFNRVIFLVIRLGIRRAALAEAIIVSALIALSVAAEQCCHFAVFTLLILQRIGSGSLAGVAFLRFKATLNLFFRIHAAVAVNTIMGILGHLVAHQDDGNSQRSADCSATGYVGSNTQDVSVRQSRHAHIVANNGIVGADTGFYRGIGNIDQGNDTDASTGTADGHTHHNRVDIEGVFAIDNHIAGRVDAHVIAGICLGGKLGNDHVKGAVHSRCSGTRNARGIGGNHFSGGCPDGHTLGDLFLFTADGRTIKDVSQGFIFEVGHYRNRCAGYRAGNRRARCNVIEVRVGIGQYRHILCRLDSADSRLDAAVEHQNIDVTGNAHRAAGAKADGQQEYIVIAVGVDANSFCRAGLLGIQLGVDGLVVYQGNNRSAYTGGAADCQRSRRVYKVTVVFGVHKNVRVGGNTDIALLRTFFAGILIVGQFFISADQSLHTVLHNQRIHNAGHSAATTHSATNGKGHDGIVSKRGNNDTASAGLTAAGNRNREGGGIVTLGGENRVINQSGDDVLIHSRVNGRANGYAAAAGQSARGNIGLTFQAGEDANAVASGEACACCLLIAAIDNGFHGAGADNNGNAAGNARAAAAAGCQNHVNKEVVALSLDENCTLCGSQFRVASNQRANITLKDTHGDGACNGRSAG